MGNVKIRCCTNYSKVQKNWMLPYSLRLAKNGLAAERCIHQTVKADKNGVELLRKP